MGAFAPPRSSPSTCALALSRASVRLPRPSGGRTSLQLSKGSECDGVRTIALPHWIIRALSEVLLAHALFAAACARPLQNPACRPGQPRRGRLSFLRPSDRECPAQGKRDGAREVGHDLRMFAFVPGAGANSPEEGSSSPVLSFVCAAVPKRAMLTACQASTTRRQPSCSPLKGRWGLRYRRFAHAAEAIGYAIEKLSDKVLAGLSLHVNDEHYNAM